MKTYIELCLAMFAVVVLTTLFTVTVIVFQGQQFTGVPIVQPQPMAQPQPKNIEGQKKDESIKLPEGEGSFFRHSVTGELVPYTGWNSSNIVENDQDIINTKDVNIKK